MLSLLNDLFELFLVLGSSKWGWLGVGFGLVASFAAWSLIEIQPEKAVASAVAFVLVFMAFAWQELGKRKE
jgi:hypothetical protein